MYSNNSYGESKKEPVDVSRNNCVFDTKDFYPIPPYAVERLLEVETFKGLTWECVCANGTIPKVLERTNYEAFGTNIIDGGYDRFDKQIDFPNTNLLAPVNNIITNPPYKHVEEFIQRSKQHAIDKIAMLLKTECENECQYEMFQDNGFPLKAIYSFGEKVSFLRISNTECISGTMAYGWYVWDRHYSGKTNKYIL